MTFTVFEYLNFGFVSNFVLRISDLRIITEQNTITPFDLISIRVF